MSTFHLVHLYLGNRFAIQTLNFCRLRNCCFQQEEDSLYQQIGLKFEEKTSKMLHLEHGFVWC